MSDRLNIGAVASLKIDVLTETGWFDDARFKRDMAAGGGSELNAIPDRLGCGERRRLCRAADRDDLDGDQRRILLDTGWNNDWMDYVFARHSVDTMLERGEIDFMVLSHWHLDHFWGIEFDTEAQPAAQALRPGDLARRGLDPVDAKGNMEVENCSGRTVPICKNNVPHEGELILTETHGGNGNGLYRLLPGVALRMFDTSMLLQVRGENVLYVNVADKGIVTVTGCGHPGIMNLLGFARDNLAGPGLYGCYGGLHLSVFDTWKPEFDSIIDEVKALGMERMGCNHCTGWMWAEKAASHGVPIIKGTDTYLGYPKR